jgi:hypothetical protein
MAHRSRWETAQAIGPLSIFYPPISRLSFLPQPAQALLQIFVDVGKVYDWPAAVLASICNRESDFGVALNPPGPTGRGDRGHGRGLMQIDDRFHGAWVMLTDDAGVPLWKKPEENIAKGAEILSDVRADLADLPPLAWICGYNADPDRVRRAAPDFDRVTTGRDYGTDVLGNAKLWHALAKNGDDCDCFLCQMPPLEIA